MNLRVIWGVFSSISALQKPSHSYGYVHFLRHDLLENSLPPYPLSTLDLTLDSSNRWVDLASKIPWDELSNLYLKRHSIKSTERPPLNPRIVIGALIIKHMCNLGDSEAISQITENIYMQYFLGYSGFSSDPPI